MMLSLSINLIRHRYLLYRLVHQQVIAQYKQSVLGLGWAIFQPAMYTLLFVVLQGLLRVPETGPPRVLSTLAATMCWSAFATAVTASSASVVLNAAIIRKIYFPRELFPAAATLTRCVDFGVGLALLAVLMLFYQTPLTLQVLWVPVLLIIQIALALSLGLVASALGAFKRDVILGVPMLLQFGIFLSPVLYPVSSIPERYRWLYQLNPVSGLMESYRRVLLMGQAPEFVTLGSTLLVTGTLLAGAYWLFKVLEPYFADVL